MKLVQFEGVRVCGLSVRTDNQSEMVPEKSKIGPVWQEFHASYRAKLPEEALLYGVYYNYESDVNGPYTLLAGASSEHEVLAELEEIEIPAGTYAVFSGEGEMPQLVFDLWQEVWSHFDQSPAPQKRAYGADFEVYLNKKQMEIFISIE